MWWALLVSYTTQAARRYLAILTMARPLELDDHLAGVSKGRTHAKGPPRVDFGEDVPKVGARPVELRGKLAARRLGPFAQVVHAPGWD